MSRTNEPKSDVQKMRNLVRDAGGRIVGRTRLQKTAYILELAGLGEGFAFEYRHYGPFSADLATATRKARILGLVIEVEQRAAWGGVYSIFSTNSAARKGVAAARVQLAKAAVEADPVELELAATAAFLAFEADDPWEETADRKPQKAAAGRLENARSLYRKLAAIQTPRPLPKIA
jgi:uncharacterized protein YwgA